MKKAAVFILIATAGLLSGCSTLERSAPPQIVEVQNPEGQIIGHRIDGQFIDNDSVGAPAAAFAATPTGNGIPLLDWLSLPHIWTPSGDVLRANSANYATYAQAQVALGIVEFSFIDSGGNPATVRVPIREVAKADNPQSPLRENQTLGLAGLATTIFRGEQRSRDNAVNQSNETARASIGQSVANTNAGADAAVRGFGAGAGNNQ